MTLRAFPLVALLLAAAASAEHNPCPWTTEEGTPYYFDEDTWDCYRIVDGKNQVNVWGTVTARLELNRS